MIKMLKKWGLAPAMVGGVMMGVALPAWTAEPPAAFAPCKVCHKAEAGVNLIGPSLWGVVGRKAGAAEGFAKYSDAMKESGIVWGPDSLAKYITDPKAAVPGNKMAFAGVKKPEDVTAIIDFLSTLK